LRSFKEACIVRYSVRLSSIVQLPRCLIGMEACCGAHHWARLFRQHGHTVKLMAPKFVTPYRLSGKCGKNDAADAAAICEAVTRPHMRFVPVKEEHQQIVLGLHRTRQGFVEERTATYNRIRGLMSEFGIVLPQKVACLRREIGAHFEDLPGYANQCVGDLLSHADQLDARVAEYDKAIAHAAREDTRSKRLMERPGIGPVRSGRRANRRRSDESGAGRSEERDPATHPWLDETADRGDSSARTADQSAGEGADGAGQTKFSLHYVALDSRCRSAYRHGDGRRDEW